MKMITEEKLEDYLHTFLQDLYNEYDGDKEAVVVIQDYIKNGEISTEQEGILKTQIEDTLKIFGIIVPFVLIPGASILMPILIKVAGKHNIQLMPKDFEN